MTRKTIKDNPVKDVLAGIYEGGEPRDDIRPFTEDEVRRLIRKTSVHYRPAMVVLARLGCRLGELCGLNLSDVDLRKKQITRRHSYRAGVVSKHTKNNFVRVIKLDDELLTIFQKLKKAPPKGSQVKQIDGPVFKSKAGLRLGQGTFRYQYKLALAAAGIEYRKVHNLRHTRATRLLEKGFTPARVSRLLGHTKSMLINGYNRQQENDDDLEMVGAL